MSRKYYYVLLATALVLLLLPITGCSLKPNMPCIPCL